MNFSLYELLNSRKYTSTYDTRFLFRRAWSYFALNIIATRLIFISKNGLSKLFDKVRHIYLRNILILCIFIKNEPKFINFLSNQIYFFDKLFHNRLPLFVNRNRNPNNLNWPYFEPGQIDDIHCILMSHMDWPSLCWNLSK